MYKKTVYLSGLTALLALTGCASHYELAGIQRTRVLVDNRYDATPDAGAAKFMEPFKHKVDSVMGPVVGEVDHDMVAHRPESDLSNLLAPHAPQHRLQTRRYCQGKEVHKNLDNL